MQAWPFVVAAYSGIEQSLKMLLAATDSNFTKEQLRKQYGHNLKKLFDALTQRDQDHIELHFQEHWSLNEYDCERLGYGTAKEFLTAISKTSSQNGSIAWRYLPLDANESIPPTDMWTMCEVWNAVCCCILPYTKPNACEAKIPCSRLSQRLCRCIQRTIEMSTHHGAFIGDLDAWMSDRSDDHLTILVDLLAKSTRGAVAEVDAPESLRLKLAQMASRVVETLSSGSPDPDVHMFLQRVQSTGRDLAWNPVSAEFVWVECLGH